MPDKYLICENCQQVVARFNPKTITYPIRSTMFEAKFPAERQVPSPWAHKDVEAEWMTCPFCPKRVFNERDPSVLTVSDSIEGYRPYSLDIGLAAVPAAQEPKTDPVRASISPDLDLGNTDACPVCGKGKADFKNASGFANHMRYCAAKHGGRPG